MAHLADRALPAPRDLLDHLVRAEGETGGAGRRPWRTGGQGSTPGLEERLVVLVSHARSLA
jgi:hypothetical protein